MQEFYYQGTLVCIDLVTFVLKGLGILELNKGLNLGLGSGLDFLFLI
ncbi:hypothetical protein [uncultured Gammaproteobacteria bacterium]|jgi:hypothetical protein|nr:hypothetical protein [uncultured Gammaproteobacteria bacterium]CAC9661732.1 hypothetical protein [uncultured Gammaproteobacteria bacterium]CAC9953409.1 hypothetical protein [uncultured Gammaproteobacteria bacterium]